MFYPPVPKHLRRRRELLEMILHPLSLAFLLVFIFTFTPPTAIVDALPNPYPSNVTYAAHLQALKSPAPPTALLSPSSRAGRRLHSDLHVAPPPPEADIAYFIQISASTLDHLPRLLDRIHHSRNHYAVHFDRKMHQESVEAKMKEIFMKRPHYKHNIIVLPSELITYRGVSMLLNTINAMRALLEHGATWHYFINLSGADYPVVSQITIRRLLGAHVNAPLNFMSFAPKENWATTASYRMLPLYVDDALSMKNGHNSKVTQLNVQNPLAGTMSVTLAHAEAWLIGSRDLCRFVVESGYARKLLLAMAYSVESSEHYFATLAWNHPRFNRTLVPNSLRHVVWHWNGKSAGQHPFYLDERDADGSFPLQGVIDQTPNLFIRKFKHANSPLMDQLDARWENRTQLSRVREHFAWAVGMGMKDNIGKRAMRPEEDVDV